jgi:hypothetical protein
MLYNQDGAGKNVELPREMFVRKLPPDATFYEQGVTKRLEADSTCQYFRNVCKVY